MALYRKCCCGCTDCVNAARTQCGDCTEGTTPCTPESVGVVFSGITFRTCALDSSGEYLTATGSPSLDRTFCLAHTPGGFFGACVWRYTRGGAPPWASGATFNFYTDSGCTSLWDTGTATDEQVTIDPLFGLVWTVTVHTALHGDLTVNLFGGALTTSAARCFNGYAYTPNGTATVTTGGVGTTSRCCA